MAAVDKAPDAFRTISEVADELDVPQHVLRFWESRFRDIKPMKRGGGRRYYRPDDVDLLRGIRHLLYGEGYTIRGVQRILREQGIKFVQAVWHPGAPQPSHGPAEESDFAQEEAEASRAAPVDPERGRGLFGILPKLLGDESEPEPVRTMPALPPVPRPLSPERIGAPTAPQTSLSREDVARLQTALRELTECRKLIDAALGPPA
jgi:DNA-binding transcriptional MerR regulator